MAALNYHLSSSESEREPPPPAKRPADKDTTETHFTGQEASTSQTQDGYVYGFILPFTVDNDEYCVVKVGSTGLGQLKRRLRDHNSEFNRATDGVPIFNPAIMSIMAAANSDEDIVKMMKVNKQEEIFLLSRVKDGLRAGESGARACIGVAPFNTGPIFRTVFPDSRRVTITEWVVARKQVIEHIQADFWYNEHVFDTADALLERLRELNKRKHITLTISLETIATQIYRNKVKVPQYTPDSRL